MPLRKSDTERKSDSYEVRVATFISHPFKWTDARVRALHMLVDGATMADIAAAANVFPDRIRFWEKHPDFIAEREALIAKRNAELDALSYEMRQRRLDLYKEMITRIWRIPVERGALDPPDGESPPGWEGGFVTRRIQSLGRGSYVNVFGVDTPLVEALNSILHQLAVELGQWSEKKELGGPNGAPLSLSILDIIMMAADMPILPPGGSSASPAAQTPEPGQGVIDGDFRHTPAPNAAEPQHADPAPPAAPKKRRL